MDTKTHLITSVRDWVRIDSEIAAIQQELAKRRKEKKAMSLALMDTMKTMNIDCVDLKDGQLIYSKNTEKKPLTKTRLMTILSEYFQGNADKAEELNTFILDNREEVVKEKIVRKKKAATKDMDT